MRALLASLMKTGGPSSGRGLIHYSQPEAVSQPFQDFSPCFGIETFGELFEQVDSHGNTTAHVPAKAAPLHSPRAYTTWEGIGVPSRSSVAVSTLHRKSAVCTLKIN